MTGLVRRIGGSIRLVHTSIEVIVVVAGWLLGGTLGVATVGVRERNWSASSGALAPAECPKVAPLASVSVVN